MTPTSLMGRAEPMYGSAKSASEGSTTAPAQAEAASRPSKIQVQSTRVLYSSTDSRVATIPAKTATSVRNSTDLYRVQRGLTDQTADRREMTPKQEKIPIEPEKRKGTQFAFWNVRRQNNTAATNNVQPIRNRAHPSTGDWLISDAVRSRKTRLLMSITNHKSCHHVNAFASRTGPTIAALPTFGTSSRNPSTLPIARAGQGFSSSIVA